MITPTPYNAKRIPIHHTPNSPSVGSQFISPAKNTLSHPIVSKYLIDSTACSRRDWARCASLGPATGDYGKSVNDEHDDQNQTSLFRSSNSPHPTSYTNQSYLQMRCRNNNLFAAQPRLSPLQIAIKHAVLKTLTSMGDRHTRVDKRVVA